MNGEVLDACLTSLLTQPFQELHTIHLGLELMRKERISHRELGVHNHNMSADPLLAQLTPFVSHRYGEIVHPMLLQRTRQLKGTRPVAIGLDHTDQRMVRREERTVVIEVVDDGTEVDIQDRLMLTRRESAVDLIEGEAPCALDQDTSIVERQERGRSE